MQRREREIRVSEGVDLKVVSWAPEGAPKFAVVVSHGQSEHVDRHAWVAEALVPRGAFVFGPDHRGEGRSGGRKGHVEGFETFAGDLAKVVEEVRTEDLPEDCPLLLFAHSMGGLIGLLFLLDHGERLGIRAAIISAPLLELALDVGVVKRFAARVANVLLPTLPIPGDVPPEDVLRDPVLLQEYIDDPHRTRAVTPRWVASMEAGQARVAAEAPKLSLPMLWYAGDEDRVCSTPATRRVFESLADPAANDQTFRLLEGVLHEPHNEPPEAREDIRAMAADWLADHAGA